VTVDAGRPDIPHLAARKIGDSCGLIALQTAPDW
jgi:hypothetical protein